MKDNPAEPGADAMILYREQIADGTKASESIYCRIKVFTEEGKKYADIEIPFFKRSGDIREVQGRTIHPDGQAIEFDGKVLEKTVVKAGSIKELVKSITLPDVTPGSIIEYRYKIQRDTDYIYNVYWRVQQGLYTKHAHFLFKPYESVGAPLHPCFSACSACRGSLRRSRKMALILSMSMISPVFPKRNTCCPSQNSAAASSSYTPGSPTPNAEDYWNAVGKRVFAEDAGFIGKRGAIKQAADEAIGSASTPEEKLRLLYVRAQQLKNTQIDAGEKTPQEMKRENQKDNKTVEDVLKRGYGSYDDINRLFVAFVQAEGFEAQRVFGTLRTNGIFHMALQDQRELDDDFVWIHLGDKDVFVDPSVALCPYGMLPWYETAIKVLRPTKQGAVFMDVPVTDSSLTVTDRNANLSVDEQGNVTGTFVVTFTGDRALSWRQEGRTKDEEARRKMMKDEVKQWFPIDTKIDITAIKNWDVTDKPLSVECKIETNGILQSAGHRVLMPVSLYTSGRPQMLQHDARKQPVFFALPYEETDEIRIQVPPTWRLESLPTRKRIDPGAHFLYEISSIQQGGFLEIKRRFSIGQQIYPVEQYATLRHIFGSVKADDEQQVVFQTQGGSSGGN